VARDLKVLFDKFAGETGPSRCEETGVDSFDPGRWEVAASSFLADAYMV
jgi:hypothetical protein